MSACEAVSARRSGDKAPPFAPGRVFSEQRKRHTRSPGRSFGRHWPIKIERATGLQAAVDQFLPEPLRELFTVAKFPPIAARSAYGFLAVNHRVTAGGAPQTLGKRQQLGVLACAASLHRLNVRRGDWRQLVTKVRRSQLTRFSSRIERRLARVPSARGRFSGLIERLLLYRQLPSTMDLLDRGHARTRPVAGHLSSGSRRRLDSIP